MVTEYTTSKINNINIKCIADRAINNINIEPIANNVNNNTNIESTTSKTNNHIDIEPITNGVNNNINIGVNMGGLSKLGENINNINTEFNTSELNRANKIIDKDVKVFNFNLFWLLLTFNRSWMPKKVFLRVLLIDQLLILINYPLRIYSLTLPILLKKSLKLIQELSG